MKIFKQKLFQLVLLMGLAIVMFSCSCYECTEWDLNMECKTYDYVDCDNNPEN